MILDGAQKLANMLAYEWLRMIRKEARDGLSCHDKERLREWVAAAIREPEKAAEFWGVGPFVGGGTDD